MSFSYNFPNGLVVGSGVNFACYTLAISLPARVQIGDDFWDASTTFTWGKDLSGGSCLSFALLPGFGANAAFPVAAGTVYADNTPVYPVIETQTAQAFNAVAPGNTVDVFLAIPFNGKVGDTIYINGNKYTVNS